MNAPDNHQPMPGRFSMTASVDRFMNRLMEKRGFERRTVQLGHRTCRYWIGGEGDATPLLLVHGFGADATANWSGNTAFRSTRKVIIPDLIWFGGSFSGAQEFSTVHQAEFLVDLLDHLGLPVVDVAGVSYGGFVALEMAHLWPDRVRRVVVIDSPGHAYRLDDYRDMLERYDIDSVADLVLPENPKDIPRLLKLAFLRPPPLPFFMVGDVHRQMFRLNRPQKIRLLDDLLRRADELSHQTFSIAHPMLIVWGEKDDLFPVHLGVRLADLVGPTCRLHVVPHTRHAPNLERPVYFNRIAQAFLDEPEPPSGATPRFADKPMATPH